MLASGGPGRSLRDRLIDATARRPSGWVARKTYGGRSGAPKGHEAVFDALLELAGPLDGQRCLEIGCGGGRLLERVLALGGTVAGLDHSTTMIELAATRNSEPLRHGAVELKLGDAAHLPWPDAAFDVVLCANSFFFFDHPDGVLAEIHRVLSSGACVVIATVPGPLPTPSFRTWWVRVWGEAMRVYDDATMRSMVEGAGFADVVITRRTEPQPLQLIRASRDE